MVIALIFSVLFLAVLALAVIRLLDLREANGIRDLLRQKIQRSADPFDPVGLTNLPEPAQRYFRASIRPGIRLASGVNLEMSGEIRLGPDEEWQPFSASQIICERGYLWEATAGRGIKWMNGRDWLVDGKGSTRFWLWGIIPVVKGEGENVDKSAKGRLAIETIMAPPMLLPDRQVLWQKLGNDVAVAGFKLMDEPYELTLHLGPDGKPLSAKLMRWGNPRPATCFSAVPFGAELSKHKEFDGYTIPTRLRVFWRYGESDSFEFFKADLARVEWF